ncbi:hypothetical protein M378DRAFT_191789 [Amanita muscaria Koide BX008]|uniref:Uncharacterized protein n=1 Tax=Amanita muscaria (strain Koide BX008) TaxID=946122 RepID=A0A0C2SUQ8_AMAMK|nr:hypothetical protein M378DRAFT_191789 [Amanita muscaria Koide BX008]
MPKAYACPSCCQLCRDLQVSPSNNDSPFDLKNLIPVGVVNIDVLDEDGETAAALCVHTHAEDDWHAFHGSALLTHLTSMADDSFCKELDFLIQHHFVSATYRFDDNRRSIIVRIYLIPYDLPNVQGRLRLRKEAISSPARRHLSALLPRIRCCREDWDGYCCQCCPPLLDTAKDDRTLAEIYSELPSPKPFNPPRREEISSRLLHFSDDLKGLGMKSTLFQYQRQSVAALLQKEMDVSAIEDPLYVSIVDLNGNRFYLQPAKMEILCERPMVSPARGGILCEELGTGKTVMILTLVVATIREISSPEESLHNEMPVMTPVAFRHFPSVFETARRCLLPGKQPVIQSGEFPSLRELLLHHRCASPDTSVPDLSTAEGVSRHRKQQHLQDRFELTKLAEAQKANTPFYLHYGNNNDSSAAPRKTTIQGPRIMYLTNATLVVVPVNLVSQWDREIIKHCEYPVRVLILRAGTPTPTARSLASDYDIILTTYPRFTAEANCKDVSKLHPWKICRCPTFKGARVPDCRCRSPNVSPFFQVRWKRLVIDEGHVSSSRFSTLIQLVRLLSVERRWIVTGTPTTNLLGLSFGNKAGAEDDEPTNQEYGDYDYLTSLQGTLTGQSTPGISTRSGSEVQTPPRNSSVRIWNKYDRGDLYKLGNMITHFVAVPQFCADVKLMYNQVTAPLLDPRGPRPGSIQVLIQVMRMVMVRHRIEDIENDVVLPPLTHNSVLLDLEPLAIKSYNALQASMAINAIDSERTDQDYLFHPSNADVLQTAVKNMSQLMLWSVDDLNLYHVDQLLVDKDTHIQRAIKRNMPEEDIRLLYDAFRHIRLAAEDPLWRASQSNEDVPYHVSRMNHRVFEVWTRTCQKDPATPMMNGVMHVNRILRLHDFVVQRPLAIEEVIVEEGRRISEEDLKLRRRFIEAQEKKGRGNKKSLPLQDEHVSELAGNATKKARAPDTLKEMQTELSVSIARLEDGENVLPAAATPRHSGSSYSEVPSSSPHAQIRIGHSASSKINWIINEIKSHSATEKFLIFSDSELSLAHVAEALELIKVKFLRFTAQIEARYREQLVLTFETSETYRVFLTELKHGARGLNLISASRVIFCEPVWQADVESQAIKRAHRIGQTKKIIVTTLAIRGTAEERMVARKELFKGSRDKIPKLIEEAGMRHFIANPKFIETKPELLTSVDEPLFRIKQLPQSRKTTSV